MSDAAGSHHGLNNLAVWVKAKDFGVFVCTHILSKIPDDEKYALISQLRRSSQSIAANIAEGYGRYYYQEGVRFAYIARGSLLETQNHLIFAREMNYIGVEVFSDLLLRLEEILKMLNGYINYLKKSKRGINEPGAGYLLNDSITK
jgi:four helix bundle protein